MVVTNNVLNTPKDNNVIAWDGLCTRDGLTLPGIKEAKKSITFSEVFRHQMNGKLKTFDEKGPKRKYFSKKKQKIENAKMKSLVESFGNKIINEKRKSDAIFSEKNQNQDLIHTHSTNLTETETESSTGGARGSCGGLVGSNKKRKL